MHSEGRNDERTDHDETERQHCRRASQGDPGHALPTRLGDDVGVFLILSDEDAVTERDEERREEGQ